MIPKQLKLSVITPVYKNETTLEELSELVFNIATPLFSDVEYIFVNDGSPDNSRNILYELSKKNPKIKVINLSRNFGQHSAIMKGFEYATGDYIFLIDGDLEEDPSYLPYFLQKLNEGFEIAVGIRQNKRDSLFKTLRSKVYTFLYNSLSDYKIIPDSTDMRLMTRRFVNYLLEFQENPFIAGFTSWIGLPIGTIPIIVNNNKRKSSYSFFKLLQHSRAGLIGFSTRILRLSLWIGFLVSSFSFIYGITSFFRYFAYGNILKGFTSIVVLITFLLGLLFIFVGFLGEYISEIFLAVKKRPSPIVYDTFNITQYQNKICVE